MNNNTDYKRATPMSEGPVCVRDLTDANFEQKLRAKLGDKKNSGRTYCVVSNSSVTNLDPLEIFTGIKEFEIYQCDNLTHLDALAQLENLEYLSISFVKCHDINLTPIGKLKKLQRLTLKNCYNDADLDFLSQLPRLTCLTIQGEGMKSVDKVKGCKKLEYLGLEANTNIEGLRGLENCKNLQTLNLYYCTQIPEQYRKCWRGKDEIQKMLKEIELLHNKIEGLFASTSTQANTVEVSTGLSEVEMLCQNINRCARI